MTHLFKRTALILLAGTALTACASSPNYAINPPVVSLPPAAQPPAQTAVAQDAAPLLALKTAPVEQRPLETLPSAAPPAPSQIAANALEALDASPALAMSAPGVDAAARTKSKASAETYTVRRGDTLAEIADRMGTSVETLARQNGLKKPYRLNPGQKLKGPNSAPAKSSGKGSAKPAAKAQAETYVVKRGDTLFAIAGKLGVSVEDLRAANGMGRSSSLMPGRTLRLPGADAPEEVSDEAPPPQRPATTRRRRDPEPEIVPPASDRSAAGRVVNIETPGKAYRVKRGDTLEKVARRLDSDIDDLARINKLKRPYRLQPGQTIRGQGGSAKAYVVARGDTLAEIAQRFSTTVDKLRAANGLRRGASVAPGRKLRLPAGYRDRGPITAPPPEREPEPPRSSFREPPPVGQTLPPPRSAPAAETLPDRPQPYTPSQRPYTPPAARPSRPSSTFTPQGSVNGAPTASPPVSDAQISQMGRGIFQWPLRGAVLSGFGDKGTSNRNDGLNIRAGAGDAVRAAASGEVVYAGDQVPGFGNLVLIKHTDGWVTAYGHLGRTNVRMQQRVEQGQTIGEAGSSGGVSEPQLHFEVRYAPTPQERARPIDPELVLPR